MSKFDALQQQLEQFRAMPFHHDARLAQRLADVQNWQKQRIRHTHADFFAKPENQLMADYFLNRLYGGPNFNELAFQIGRIINNAGIVEKVIPASAIRTGNAGVELAVLAIQMDQDLAQHILQHYPVDQSLNDEVMCATYLKLDQYQPRQHQMDLLDELGHNMDKYVRSRMIRAAFKLAKGPAHKYRIESMYDFIGEGFAAMEPLPSAASFVETFTTREREIIEKVHAGDTQPFA